MSARVTLCPHVTYLMTYRITGRFILYEIVRVSEREREREEAPFERERERKRERERERERKRLDSLSFPCYASSK